jgi:hypothetical protein
MERLEIIETLKHNPDLVAVETAGLDAAALTYRPGDGQWSIKEVAGHLKDSAEVWYRRLYMVWSQTDPLFLSFDGEAYVRDRAYQDADIRAIVAGFKTERLKTVDLLSHAVDWTRTGQQRGVGRRSLKQFAEFLIEHDQDHIAQIRSLKTAAQTPASA